MYIYILSVGYNVNVMLHFMNSESIWIIFLMKRKYIYICWTKLRRQKNHWILLKQVMWLEQTLDVTITDIVDILRLKQV
jgi:hypothetical protein